MYDSFNWNCYNPEIHRIEKPYVEKLRFLGISLYKLKSKIWDFVSAPVSGEVD